MATKLKVRILKPAEELNPAVQAWISKYNIKFDRYGYGDAPRTDERDLYGAINAYHVPMDPDVRVYQTLDHKHYYTTGKNPIHERRRMVVHPLIIVERQGNDIIIARREIIRGQEIATLHEETLYSGPIEGLPPSLQLYDSLHTRTLLEELRMELDPEYRQKVLESRRRRYPIDNGANSGRKLRRRSIAKRKSRLSKLSKEEILV